MVVLLHDRNFQVQGSPTLEGAAYPWQARLCVRVTVAGTEQAQSELILIVRVVCACSPDAAPQEHHREGHRLHHGRPATERRPAMHDAGVHGHQPLRH